MPRYIRVSLFIACLLLILFLIPYLSTSIVLHGDAIVVLDVGSTYRELGADATFFGQNVDVEILSDLHLDEIGKQYVTYRVKNSFGLLKEVRRTIIIVDRIPPVISLMGGETISLTVGEPYVELGYAALDAVDGLLTDDVQIQNHVDTHKIGTYEVIYEVVDQSGNLATKKRTVVIQSEVGSYPDEAETYANQTLEWQPGNPLDVFHVYDHGRDSKVLYLTFDTISSNTDLTSFLDLLQEEDVVATFFLQQSYMKAHPELVRQMSMIHSIGNGGVSGISLSRYANVSSWVSFVMELYDNELLYTDLTGNMMDSIYRNSSYSSRSLYLLDYLGYHTYFWTAEIQKNHSQTKEELLSYLIAHSTDGTIYRIADYQSTTLSALCDFIRMMKGRGYTFSYVREIT